MWSHFRNSGLKLFSTVLVLAICSIPKVLQLRAQDPAARDSTAWDARRIAILLLDHYPELTDRDSRAALRAAVAIYDKGWATIAQAYNQRSTGPAEKVQQGLREGEELFHQSTTQFAAVYGRLPALTIGGAGSVINRSVSVPFGSTALLLKRRVDGQRLRFLHRRIDLSVPAQTIDAGTQGDFYCLLELVNPSPASSQVNLSVTNGRDLLQRIELTSSIPAKYPLHVQIADSNGQPEDAAVGLYSSGNRFLVPDTALDFSGRGFFYQPVRYRDCARARYWPGGEDSSLCFFVPDAFTIDVPAGTYRLLVSKGPEYLPVDQTVTVSRRGSDASIVLRCWINMASRGWYSGDAHFHFARPDPATNKAIELWSQAEDLRMINVLRMGDGLKTYFEQYSFGKAGRYIAPGVAIVPGQEDPRTSIMGHMIGLDLQSPARDLAPGYYVYRHIFDWIRRQGGLAGYAHITTYPRSAGAYRDMALNLPTVSPDFFEICENGAVDTDVYYDFLNLGFRLTAMGGSDVPWGGTAGESRVYVHGGPTFDADRWFAEVKQGHSFVTAGPMLEFNVAGRLPGDDITARRGELLKVHAKAMVGSSLVPLEHLEVVANGDIVRSAAAHEHSAVLDFGLPIEQSMWIAARTSGAHTTPIYISVDGKRHWKQDAVPTLLDKCNKALDEIDDLVAHNGDNIAPNRDGEWENADSFRAGAAELRRQVQQARAAYQQLRREWQADTSK